MLYGRAGLDSDGLKEEEAEDAFSAVTGFKSVPMGGALGPVTSNLHLFFLCRVYYNIGSDSTTLTIKKVTPADAGKYEVFVENSLGMDQSFARLDVA